MAGHTATPYEIIATRAYARDPKEKANHLLLASIGKDVTVDLLDAVVTAVPNVEPVTSADKQTTFSCVLAEKDGDSVGMVFALDVSGHREVVFDEDRNYRFTKAGDDVTRFYSCGLLWRPSGGTEGMLIVHSPWGRGGSRAQVMKLMQRAVAANPDAKAKLSACPIVPAKILQRWLNKANATKITYSRTAAVSSTFGESTRREAQAEVDLVVKGSNTITFRDSLAKALKATANKEKFFTLRIEDPDAAAGYRDEIFDDVTVQIDTPGGTRSYSMKNETIPTLGFDFTPEANHVYHALPDDDEKVWPEEILSGLFAHLELIVTRVNADR